MKNSLLLFILLATLPFSCLADQPKPKIKFAILQSNLAHLEAWIKDDILDTINANQTPLLDRAMAEILIQLRALDLAGFSYDNELLIVPNIRRASEFGEEQRFDLVAAGYWSDDPDMAPSLLKSIPYIEHGEALVGLYTSANNIDALSKKSIEQLRELRFIVVDSWHTDVRTLQKVGGLDIHYAKHYLYLMTMLEAGRADVAILEFTSNGGLGRYHRTKDQSTKLFWLHAIPNIKAYLDGERVFVVAANSPHAQELLAALNKGITTMRETGELQQILAQAGYYPKETENWPSLWPTNFDN